MKATVVDLRYKMKNILRALDRNEEVHILYHGKEKGVIIPAQRLATKKSVQEHALFGMLKDDTRSVEEIMKELRAGRY